MSRILGIISAAILLIFTASGTALAVWENTDHAVVLEPVGGARYVSTCPDGHGGMLVAGFDTGVVGVPIMVSRLDCVGNELWGDGGVNVPFNLSVDSQQGPVSVAPDGYGGAYVAYREVWPGDLHIVTVARFDATGNYLWSQPIGDFGGNDADLKVEAVATSLGVILVWSQKNPFPNSSLRAARVFSDGTEDWEVQLADGINMAPDATVWHTAEDQQGGVLVTFDRQTTFPNPREHRVARVNYSGVLSWGLNGVLLWTNFGAVHGVLSDQGGGAIVINDKDYGEVWAQRVLGSGTLAWAAGGVRVLDLDLSLMLDQVGFCADGYGGAVVVTGLGDLYAQRVDHNGTRLWNGGGVGGVQVSTLAGWQEAPAVCRDSQGSFIVVYRDHYYSDGTDPNNQMLGGARIRPNGTLAWSDEILLWHGWQDGYEPLGIQLAPDLHGGALIAWIEIPYYGSYGDVYATAVGGDASVPPTAELAYLSPDAGVPGASQSGMLRGKYIDTNLDYALRRGGQPDVTLTELMLHTPELLEVGVDLTSAEAGPWDLVMLDGGVVEQTLPALFGVGEAPPDLARGAVSLYDEGERQPAQGGGRQQRSGSRGLRQPGRHPRFRPSAYHLRHRGPSAPGLGCTAEHLSRRSGPGRRRRRLAAPGLAGVPGAGWFRVPALQSGRNPVVPDLRDGIGHPVPGPGRQRFGDGARGAHTARVDRLRHGRAPDHR